MRHGFTLIELLIVIAIIAILALIAIPNFLEAQTRAKVSRVRADMRSLATAIEAYFVDNNTYPVKPLANASMPMYYTWLDADVDPSKPANQRLPVIGLTTPVSYITSFPIDPFQEQDQSLSDGYWHLSYFYYNFDGAARLYGANPGVFTFEPVSPAPVRFNLGVDYDGPLDNVTTYWSMWGMLSPGPDLSTSSDWGVTTGNGRSRSFLQGPKGWDNLQYGRCNLYDPTNGVVSPGDIWRLSYSMQ